MGAFRLTVSCVLRGQKFPKMFAFTRMARTYCPTRQIIQRTEGMIAKRYAGAWTYREIVPQKGKLSNRMADIAGATAWCWILWHFWHEPDHVFGHYEYPDVTKWTHSELGIPPDDED